MERQGNKIETTLTPSKIAGYTSSGAWQGRLITDYLAEHVTSQPEKVAVVDGKRKVTYGELNRVSDCLACAFLELDIKKGDTVSVQLPNCTEFFQVYIALMKIGAMINPVVPVYRSSELKNMVSLAKSVALVIPTWYRKFNHVEMALQLRAELPHLKHIIAVGEDKPADVLSLSELILKADQSGHQHELRHLIPDANDVFMVMFTSGTEADPKGVMHTHNTINFGMSMRARNVAFTADDSVLVMSPVTAGMGFYSGVYMTLMFGAKAVLVESWNPREAVRMIEAEGCTFTHTAPTFLYDLVNVLKSEKHDLSSLRFVSCGGGALSSDLMDALKSEVGCKVGRTYGSTETITSTMTTLNDPEEKIRETNGRPLPGTEFGIVDEENREMPRGEAGEAVVRSPALFVGYLGRPDLNASYFDKGGWFHTGDLCAVDRDGYVAVVGRKKEMIKRGGYNISASEIEGLLHLHPKIEKAAVIGIFDERLGEKACACIMLKAGQELGFEEMVSFLREKKIAVWKLPERMEILKEFPMTATGKLNKKALRDNMCQSSRIS